MYINNSNIQEYPFTGVFYTIGIDYDKPLDEQVEEEITILDTVCDIQEANAGERSGFINATYSVYFPFDELETFNVEKGMSFRGSIYGLNISGSVVGLFPTQLGGCTAYIKAIDV